MVNATEHDGRPAWSLPGGMTLERRDPDDREAGVEWDRFIACRPEATPFHLRGWLSSLSAAYGYRTSLFLLRDERGGMAAVLPLAAVRVPFRSRRHVSLPFSDYGGGLACDSVAQEGLLRGVVGACEDGAGHLEVRGAVPGGLPWQATTPYVRHVLDLRAGADRVFKGLEPRTIRYSIRKAERCGVVVEDATATDGLDEFYRLHLLTRAKHGVPSQPKRFFRLLLDRLPPGGTPTILIARDGGTAIAAGFFIEFKGTLDFKYSASDPATLTAKTPNHLLTWRAIEGACERRLEGLDFGRSSVANEGLCRYKRMWGARETPLSYSYYPAGPRVQQAGESGRAYDLLTSAWRRLPPSVQAVVGPRVYRYLA
jgi:CelD/BcsL family acetyltransferase involved in cellulose biosynthesis